MFVWAKPTGHLKQKIPANAPLIVFINKLIKWCKIQKHGLCSSNYRFPVQITECRVQSLEYRVQSTEYRVQSTKYRVQSTVMSYIFRAHHKKFQL